MPLTNAEKQVRARKKKAATLARYREALAFYADPDGDGYRVDVTDYGLSTEEGDIVRDAGKRARQALNPDAKDV